MSAMPRTAWPHAPLRFEVALDPTEVLVRLIDDECVRAVGVPDPRPGIPAPRPKRVLWELRAHGADRYELWATEARHTLPPRRAIVSLTTQSDRGRTSIEVVATRDPGRGETFERLLEVGLLLTWPVVDPLDFGASVLIAVGRGFRAIGRAFAWLGGRRALPQAVSEGDRANRSPQRAATQRALDGADADAEVNPRPGEHGSRAYARGDNRDEASAPPPATTLSARRDGRRALDAARDSLVGLLGRCFARDTVSRTDADPSPFRDL